MEIILVSDTHGNLDVLEKIHQLHPHADSYLHLGDSERYPQEIAPFVSVQGNCDLSDAYPAFRYFRNRYGRFYLEHGHRMRLMSYSYIVSKNADFFIYGHTHCLRNEFFQNVHILNPGSAVYPRDGDHGTYLRLYWDEKGNLTITPLSL